MCKTIIEEIIEKIIEEVSNLKNKRGQVRKYRRTLGKYITFQIKCNFDIYTECQNVLYTECLIL